MFEKFLLLINTYQVTLKICAKLHTGLNIKCPLSLYNFNWKWNVKTYFSKLPYMIFHENPYSGSQTATCRWTDKKWRSQALDFITAAGSLQCMGVYDGRFNELQWMTEKCKMDSKYRKKVFYNEQSYCRLVTAFSQRKYLTYKLQKCVSFFEKLIIIQLVKKFPAFHGTQASLSCTHVQYWTFSSARWNKDTV